MARHKQTFVVMGSFGKTTTARAVRAVLGLPPSLWTELNANHMGEIGWAFLKEPPSYLYSVVEIGASLPGRLSRYVRALHPDVIIMTSLGREHLLTFKTIEALRQEKTEGLKMLPPGGTAILNGDDEQVRWMSAQIQRKILWFGTTVDCDVRASSIELDWPNGMKFIVTVKGESLPVETKLIGKKTIYPVLAAITAGVYAGISLKLIIANLGKLLPTRERLEPLLLANGAYLLDDSYKSTPDTVYEAFDVLRSIPAKKRWIVMGHLNNMPTANTAIYYQSVGEKMADVADYVVLVGDHSQEYKEGLICGNFPLDCVWNFSTTAEVTVFLQTRLSGGDIVLIKAHEDQGLRRTVLALRDNRQTRCSIKFCRLHDQFCDNCPLLY